MRQNSSEWQEWLLRVISSPVDPFQLFKSSPSRLPAVIGNDRFRFLSLFHPNDLIWVGQINHSYPRNFANVRTLLEDDGLNAPFVSTSSFKAGAIRRAKDYVLHRRFIVVESDKLSIPQQSALLLALRAEWSLAAVVYTGGKSLHGWFRWKDEWNSDEGLVEAKARISAYECDTSCFSPTQPYRLPGVLRPGTDNLQSLIYLNMQYSYAKL